MIGPIWDRFTQNNFDGLINIVSFVENNFCDDGKSSLKTILSNDQTNFLK